MVVGSRLACQIGGDVVVHFFPTGPLCSISAQSDAYGLAEELFYAEICRIDAPADF